MRLTQHLAGAAFVVGFAVARGPVWNRECRVAVLKFNNTNVPALAHCAEFAYYCPSSTAADGADDFDADGEVVPPECTKRLYGVGSEASMEGELDVPGLTEAESVWLEGISEYRSLRNHSVITHGVPLRLTSISLPDLVTIKPGSLFINKTTNLTSLEVPKLISIYTDLSINLTGGPAIELSFPSLRKVRFISLTGNINFISMPVLNEAYKIEVYSTGDLNCHAFLEKVANATLPTIGHSLASDRIVCSSNRGSLTTILPIPTSTSTGTPTTPPTTPPTSTTTSVSGCDGAFRVNGYLLALTGFVGYMLVV